MIITSDLHVHKHASFSKNNENGHSRLNNIIKVLYDITDYAVKNNKKTIVVVGDIFHTKYVVNGSTYNKFYDWLYETGAKANRRIVLLSGNHDIATLSDEGNTLLQAFSSIPKVKVITEPSIVESPSLDGYANCFFMPYRRNLELCKNIIKDFSEYKTDDAPRLLFYHGSILGAMTNASVAYSDSSTSLCVDDLCPDKFDMIFLGHFHKRQLVCKNGLYTGSPIQHDLNDMGNEKGFYDFDLKNLKLKFVPVKAPQFKKIDINSREDISKVDILNNYDYYTIVLKTNDVSIDDFRNFKGQHNIRIKMDTKTVSETRLDIDFKDITNISNIVNKYVETSSTELNKERLIKMGHEYLKKVGRVNE